MIYRTVQGKHHLLYMTCIDVSFICKATRWPFLVLSLVCCNHYFLKGNTQDPQWLFSTIIQQRFSQRMTTKHLVSVQDNSHQMESRIADWTIMTLTTSLSKTAITQLCFCFLDSLLHWNLNCRWINISWKHLFLQSIATAVETRCLQYSWLLSYSWLVDVSTDMSCAIFAVEVDYSAIASSCGSVRTSTTSVYKVKSSGPHSRNLSSVLARGASFCCSST